MVNIFRKVWRILRQCLGACNEIRTTLIWDIKNDLNADMYYTYPGLKTIF